MGKSEKNQGNKHKKQVFEFFGKLQNSILKKFDSKNDDWYCVLSAAQNYFTITFFLP
jgi:hypothetical protein